MRILACATGCLFLLSGCHTAYNDPGRFLGRLDPATLATIEPPLKDEHPDWPKLNGPSYGNVYQPSAYGPAHGAWASSR